MVDFEAKPLPTAALVRPSTTQPLPAALPLDLKPDSSDEAAQVRMVQITDSREARQVERLVQRGELATGRPFLNPLASGAAAPIQGAG